MQTKTFALKRFFPTGLLLFASEILALIWVALWNGYPVFFYDTGWYLIDVFDKISDGQKALAYAYLIRYSGAGIYLWPTVFFQALCVWFCLKMTWKTFGMQDRIWSRAVATLLLCIGSSLSWEISHILPDVFAAITVLSLYSLLTHSARMTHVERMVLSVIFVVSNVVHNSDYLLATGLIASAFIIVQIGGLKPIASKNFVFPSLLIVASLLIVLGLNFKRTGKVFLHSTSHVYIANRMIEDEIITTLLKEHCADNKYALCKYADLIPQGRLNFLFKKPQVFNAIGGWSHSREVLMPVILDSFYYYPLRNIHAALTQSFYQLVSFDIASFIFVFRQSDGLGDILQKFFPGELPKFSASKQQQGRLKSPGFAVFHIFIIIISIGICAVLIRRAAFPYRPLLSSLMAFSALAIVMNAVICGSLSHAEERYGSRIIWLIPLCAWMAWESTRDRGRPS